MKIQNIWHIALQFRKETLQETTLESVPCEMIVPDKLNPELPYLFEIQIEGKRYLVKEIK